MTSEAAALPALMGKILWVDLTSGACAEETVPAWVYEQFLGGLGLAGYYLYQRIPAGANPLGKDNVIAFVPGLLTASGSMMTGRWMAASKSPLTGTWGDANCGGSLAPAIKQAGYDGIFITGTSAQPVCLHIDHGRAELRPAADLWGKDTVETEALLKARAKGRVISVACIGPAGERLSLLAGISNDQGRLAARSGLGAVMGSKKLKALVINGAYPVEPADPAAMKRLTDGFLKAAGFQPPFLNGAATRLLGTLLRALPLQMRQDGILYKFFLTKYGTIGLDQYSTETGDSPVRNWAGTNEDMPPSRSKVYNPDRIRARETMKYHCYSCPVGCGGFTKFRGGETHKPEYETVTALGSLLMNEDLDSIFAANDLLNRAGMDSISAGGTVAFALECYENGLITREDTGGLELTWGNSDSILKLLEMMVAREGIGDLLADGSRAAAARIGERACAYSVQAGGQELAQHDSRNDPGFALHAVVEPTPGRHTLGSYLYYEMFQLWRRVKSLPRVKELFYPKGWKYGRSEEKAVWAAACSQYTSLLNGAGACLFGAFLGAHRFPIFEWLNAATGWSKSPEEYMAIGRNIHAVRQAFNQREGIALAHEINPRALGQPSQSKGANRGRSVPLDELVPIYWRRMGLDERSGAVPEADLRALGLKEA